MDISQAKYNILSGSLYSQGIAFDPFFNQSVFSNKEQAYNKTETPDFLIRLGKKYLQSSSSSMWALTSNPSFSYMKPWWLSTVSLGLLTAEIYQMEGTLSPGFCPYHFTLTPNDNFQIQQLLQTSLMSNNTGMVNFIEDVPYSSDIAFYQNSSGIRPFSTDRTREENWVSWEFQNNALTKQINDLTQNTSILAAIILSMITAAWMAITILLVFKFVMVVIKKQIIQRIDHHKKYFELLKMKIVQYRNAEKPPQLQDHQFKLTSTFKESLIKNFLKDIPRISSFIAYYSLFIFKKYRINSISNFCSFLFRPATNQEKEALANGKIPNKLNLKERVLKDQYEKFCFLNNYSEMRLSDNVQIFETYGFTFIEDDESNAFTGLYERKIKQEIDISILTVDNSFEVFLGAYYEITHIDEDVEWMDEIEQNYSVFCVRYNLMKQEVKAKNISSLYGLTTTLRKRKKLVFNNFRADSLTLNINDEKKEEKARFGNCWNLFKKQERSVFVIDPNQLDIQSTLIVDPDCNFDNYNKYKEVTCDGISDKMVFFNRWFRAELAIVYVHLIIKTLFILPMILIVLLMEINYAFYAYNLDDANIITM